MKKFRIIGIIAIIIIIAHTIGSFSDFSKGYNEGWNYAANIAAKSISNDPYEVSIHSITVSALEDTPWDKVSNSAFEKEVPYQTRSIITYVKPSKCHNIIMMLVFPLVIVFLYGFYCLIRFLLDVSKRKIFSNKNVHRIRYFSYSYIAVQLYIVSLQWFKEQAAIAQISLPGYELIGDTLIETDWISMILIVLFTEIFAMGTKIKEEQDLTI